LVPSSSSGAGQLVALAAVGRHERLIRLGVLGEPRQLLVERRQPLGQLALAIRGRRRADRVDQRAAAGAQRQVEAAHHLAAVGRHDDDGPAHDLGRGPDLLGLGRGDAGGDHDQVDPADLAHQRHRVLLGHRRQREHPGRAVGAQLGHRRRRRGDRIAGAQRRHQRRVDHAEHADLLAARRHHRRWRQRDAGRRRQVGHLARQPHLIGAGRQIVGAQAHRRHRQLVLIDARQEIGLQVLLRPGLGIDRRPRVQQRASVDDHHRVLGPRRRDQLGGPGEIAQGIGRAAARLDLPADLGEGEHGDGGLGRRGGRGLAGAPGAAKHGQEG
jgi:hypothetical protein